MNIIKIEQANFFVEKWAGGATEEIFIYPEGSSYKDGDFAVRISSATMEKDEAKFSALPGVYRFICPLDAKLTLFSKRKELTALEPFEVFDFDGDVPITGKGKCRDFNLMLKGSADGYMKTWDTEKSGVKKIQLKKGTIVWLFSYSSKCSLTVNDTEVEIKKMEFIKIDDAKKSVTLKANCKAKLIYGVIYC